ncbi:hypothetical protein SELMODRAFT_160384 [Selaginella moellendorffii]|uniref:AB hydrolase-1 domain-containing protein n=1 Tax=Selaginella moellendorffii TaxID=88036 RepID=D8T2C1_SELML|nr:pheophytinase, chloroplastic [Selaginella moellendorffii]EFJ09237.1 hypothetical protein SELMODRAFT_160384 [Selaginella moellendorffii]|eukprot:XP_002989760.1 pheophytinase, chloroplastic [Selaginella moellendorffii]
MALSSPPPAAARVIRPGGNLLQGARWRSSIDRPLLRGITRRIFIDLPLVAAGLLLCRAAYADTMAPNYRGLERLPFKKEGYNFWKWKTHRIHYVVEGQGAPVLLVHGFGASAFHWRYNIPELAKYFKVYAMDLLGFGLSDKALVEYDPFLWREQVAAFAREVVQEPVVLVGNSIGGFTVLHTASVYPELVSGVVLLNSSGQFESELKEKKAKPVVEETALRRLINPIQEWGRRWLVFLTFWQAKQPSRIRSVLQNVYKDNENVDDYLVESIVLPTKDPNAAEVYYRMMSSFMLRPSTLTMDSLLSNLSCPLLLLWGVLDPWVGPGKAEKIRAFYKDTTVVTLEAGHCPHDEAPGEVNKALVEWISAKVSNRA